MIALLAFLILLVVADKLIGMYAEILYDEWRENVERKIRDQDGKEICYNNCPPGYYFTVFRFSSEFHYPFPNWTRRFKTYGRVYCRTSVVFCGPMTPVPDP